MFSSSLLIKGLRAMTAPQQHPLDRNGECNSFVSSPNPFVLPLLIHLRETRPQFFSIFFHLRNSCLNHSLRFSFPSPFFSFFGWLASFKQPEQRSFAGSHCSRETMGIIHCLTHIRPLLQIPIHALYPLLNSEVQARKVPVLHNPPSPPSLAVL